MRNRFNLATLTAIVVSFAIPGAFGDEKLKTTTDQLPKTTVKFDMVQLPAGKVTLKDGKEYDIKPIWIGTTEVTRLGMGAQEMDAIAGLIAAVLVEEEDPRQVKARAQELRAGFQTVGYTF